MFDSARTTMALLKACAHPPQKERKVSIRKIKVKFVLIEVPEEDIDHTDPAQSTASQRIEASIRLLTPKHLPANLDIVLCSLSQKDTLGAAAAWSIWRASTSLPDKSVHLLPQSTISLPEAVKKLTQEYTSRETLTALTPTTDIRQFTSVMGGLPTGKEDFPQDDLPYLTAICMFQLKPDQKPEMTEFFW